MCKAQESTVSDKHQVEDAYQQEKAFLMAEHASLRNEMDMVQKQSYTMEITLLAGLFGILAFVIKDMPESAGHYLGYILMGAGVAVALACLKKLQFMYAINILQKHLYNTEKRFTEKGWEAFQNSLGSKEFSAQPRGDKERILFFIGNKATGLFWLAMASIAVVLFFTGVNLL